MAKKVKAEKCLHIEVAKSIWSNELQKIACPSPSKQNYSPHDYQERYLNSDKLDPPAFLGTHLNAFTASNGCKHMHSNSLNQNNRFKTSHKTCKC